MKNLIFSAIFCLFSVIGYSQTKTEYYLSSLVPFLINQDFYINNDHLLSRKFEYNYGLYLQNISVSYLIPNSDKVSWHLQYQLDSNCSMKIKQMTLFWEDESLYNEMFNFCIERKMVKESTNEYCSCDFIFSEKNVSYIFKKNGSVVILVE